MVKNAKVVPAPKSDTTSRGSFYVQIFKNLFRNNFRFTKKLQR